MESRVKKTLVFVLAGILCVTLAAPSAMAAGEGARYEPGSGEMVFDAVFLRPAGLLAFVGGTAVWVVSLPFSLVAGNASQAAGTLMGEPLQFTFTRPLGQYDTAYPE